MDPDAPFGSPQYGNYVHHGGPFHDYIADQYPDTVFKFNTGPGQIGPDIEWVNGPKPFDAGELKPGTLSGWKQFNGQMNSQNGGWGGSTGFFSYDTNGNIQFGGIFQ
jgi:hypothetical protein